MTNLPHTRLSQALDNILRSIGEWVSWVWILLLAVIIVNVVLRYLFSEGRVGFEGCGSERVISHEPFSLLGSTHHLLP